MNQPLPALTKVEYTDTLHRIFRLKVAELKDLCRSLGLKLSGKKQDLVERIEDYINNSKEDSCRMLTIRTLVIKRCNGEELPNSTDLYNAIRSGKFTINAPNQYSREAGATKAHSSDSQPYKGHSLYFKESPFYTLRRQIHGSPQACLPSTGKGVCPFTFLFTKEEANLVYSGDPTVRVYLLCGLQDGKSSASTEVPLQFPLPVEVHVNGTQVTKNFRGIKGKPGTAKPADITDLLKPSQNKVSVIYTQTTETYLVYIYIVNVVSCEEIIKNIEKKPMLHKSATVSKIVSQNQGDDEDDIVISSSSITLRDPLSYTKMQYPVQSIFCNHAQCFDGLVFLQSQLQLPSWNCPICGTALNIEDLSISDYFNEVLNSVPEDVDSVQINEDGSWELEQAYLEAKANKPDKEESHSSALNEDRQIETIDIVSLDSDNDDEDLTPSTTAPVASSVEPVSNRPVGNSSRESSSTDTSLQPSVNQGSPQSANLTQSQSPIQIRPITNPPTNQTSQSVSPQSSMFPNTLAPIQGQNRINENLPLAQILPISGTFSRIQPLQHSLPSHHRASTSPTSASSPGPLQGSFNRPDYPYSPVPPNGSVRHSSFSRPYSGQISPTEQQHIYNARSTNHHNSFNQSSAIRPSTSPHTGHSELAKLAKIADQSYSRLPSPKNSVVPHTSQPASPAAPPIVVELDSESEGEPESATTSNSRTHAAPQALQRTPPDPQALQSELHPDSLVRTSVTSSLPRINTKPSENSRISINELVDNTDGQPSQGLDTMEIDKTARPQTEGRENALQGQSLPERPKPRGPDVSKIFIRPRRPDPRNSQRTRTQRDSEGSQSPTVQTNATMSPGSAQGSTTVSNGTTGSLTQQPQNSDPQPRPLSRGPFSPQTSSPPQRSDDPQTFAPLPRPPLPPPPRPVSEVSTKDQSSGTVTKLPPLPPPPYPPPSRTHEETNRSPDNANPETTLPHVAPPASGPTTQSLIPSTQVTAPSQNDTNQVDQRQSYPNGFRDTLEAQERHRVLQRERKEKHEEYRRSIRNRQGIDVPEAEEFTPRLDTPAEKNPSDNVAGNPGSGNNSKASNGNGVPLTSRNSPPPPTDTESSEPPTLAPPLRYSRSAFDVMNLATSQELPPAHKKQKVTGILGIELNEDNISDRTTISPLNGKINSMRLETPNTSRIEESDEE